MDEGSVPHVEWSECKKLLGVMVVKGKKYFRRSYFSEVKFRWVIHYFAHDLPASKITKLSDVSRPTVNQLLFKLRTQIAQLCDASSPFSGEVVEVDESYFSRRRVRGKKGRGAGGKTIVFGILERHGKGYTEIVPNAAKKPLQAAIRGQVALDRIIHSDGWGATTFHVERWNNTLRQHLARFVRKTLSFPKCIIMYEICLKLFLYRYIQSYFQLYDYIAIYKLAATAVWLKQIPASGAVLRYTALDIAPPRCFGAVRNYPVRPEKAVVLDYGTFDGVCVLRDQGSAPNPACPPT